MIMPALSIARAEFNYSHQSYDEYVSQKLLLQHIQTKKLKRKSCYRMSKKIQITQLSNGFLFKCNL